MIKGFFQRLAVRFFAPVFIIFLLFSWVLATPYAILDRYACREHFRDIRGLMSRSSWLSSWDMLKTGTF